MTDGRHLLVAPLDAGDTLTYSYRQSIYDVPVYEEFLRRDYALDLSNSVKIKLLSDNDAIKKMADKYGPFYVAAKIPAGTYKDVPETTVSSVQNLLVVNAKMDPALARAIVQTMFDNKADLEAIHSAAKELTLATASAGSPLPFHPGAIDFYKSKGVWKQ